MGCPDIPDLSVKELGDAILDKAEEERLPFKGSVELTYRCNLKCVHCYIDEDNPRKELNYAEFCHVLDQISDEGCMWLLLTGGEPLVRKDFFDIYTYAKRKGMIIYLFTNGTLINKEVADFLEDWQPFSIEITLYGATKDTYEKVTGVPGSFERCLKGINNLVERGLPLNLKTMAMTINQHELRAMKKLAEDLGLRFRFDPVLFPTLKGSKRPREFALTAKEIVDLDIGDAKRMEEWKKLCEKFLGPPPNSEQLYLCAAGRRSFWLNPYGEMSVCALSRSPAYNILRGSFREAWHKMIPQVTSQRRTRDVPCTKCDLFAVCLQCPGQSELWHRDKEKPVEFKCRLAHLRAKRIINKVASPDILRKVKVQKIESDL